MGRTLVVRIRRCALQLALGLALAPSLALAQTGQITGRVADAQRIPIAGAQVVVAGTRLGTTTGANGVYTLANVPAGTHQVRVSYVGFREASFEVSVESGAAAELNVVLEAAPVELAGIVVSASRREQRITEAPATVTRIDANVIDNSVGNTWAGALKQAVGLDFIQVGMTSVAINARGFNSSFNNRMLMMEDGRVAVLPENGLPVGQFTAVPKIDLAGLEVLVGPGAALYGADASSGVVTLQSKDPRLFPGTTAEVTGGNQGYKDVQLRHAGEVGNWGYKFAGEWQDAEDFSNVLGYTITGLPTGTKVVRETELGENSIDFHSKALRGSGALVYYHDQSRFEISGGASQSSGVGQTNVGRNQLKDWGYNFVQAKFSSPRWYLNAYRTQSTSGESFAINRYADAYAHNPTLSPDSLRKLSDWPSDGRLYAAEAQNNFRLAPLLNTRVVWGGQFRRDVVSSDRQWLTDRLTGKDIEIDQFGPYAQTETPVVSWLDVVLAARMDDHQNYDRQFSPKAGVVVKPAADQAVRVTYNRAFKSPTTLQTNFYIPDWTAVIAIYGNTEGFTIKNAAGEVATTYDPLRPEENVTWEVGYKGVIGGKLFVDATGYHSRYEHFLSPLFIISNPFGGAAATFAYDSKGQLIKNDAGITPLTLTYINLGQATIYGTDVGVNYFVTPKVNVKGTMSLLEVSEMKVPKGSEEATSINAPATKWTLSSGFTDVGNFSGGATLRYVNGYYFRSGINSGVIPTFSTLDLSAAYRLPVLNTSVQVGVSNLFTCSQKIDKEGVGFRYAPADALHLSPTNRERACGIGQKHQEMINMPNLGTMVFVGLRYSTR